MDEVRLPLEDELAVAYAGRQEEKALRESDRRYVSMTGFLGINESVSTWVGHLFPSGPDL